MCKIDHSRRQFMKTASYAAMTGVTASPLMHSMRALAAMSSHAAPAATDYRAMVCVYLQGGNDGHGTLIATDPDSFSAFTQALQLRPLCAGCKHRYPDRAHHQGPVELRHGYPAQVAFLPFRSDQCLGSGRRRWRQPWMGRSHG